ncbi:MAG: cysteine desulfurase family protein [Bryobacteraceae bacterium]|nr:cysteine desulfurase family protein [Bryobacteraceae bacterium]
MQRAYFDHNATTPLAEPVLAAIAACLRDTFGNASSIHQDGQRARQAIEAARRTIAVKVGAKPEEVILTSGATEAANLALFGLRPRHVVTTAIEHPAVLHTCRELPDSTVVRVGSDGVVDPDDVRRALRPDTDLVAVMAVNNELGTIQPIAEISALGVPVMSDQVQALGKIDLPRADIRIFSAHKVYGPKGAGALVVRKGITLQPTVFGGRHERGRRPGTENVAGAVGFGAAVANLPTDTARIATLRDRLESAILDRVPGARVNAAHAPRVANTTNIRFEGIEGEALLIALDLAGFAVSSGAACSSGAVEPSHVLTAIGLSKEEAKSSLRFSLGASNTVEQVDRLVAAVAHSVERLRKLSPVYA